MRTASCDHPRLHRYAVLTAGATFLLLIAGGLVTSTDSGLAVPDWPLSYGTWFPPLVGGIRYEHGHRMIAAVVAVMILVLAVWLGGMERRRWVRWLGYSALGAVFLQALLGGLTVLLLLPPQISIAHACLGQTVFCLVVCLARCTAPDWPDVPERFDDPAAVFRQRLGFTLALVAVIQLVLGAVIRHTGLLVGLHVGGAVILACVTGALAASVARVRRRIPWILSAARRLVILVSLQLALGAAVFTHRLVAGLRTAHVAVGALILAQSIVLAWELLRRTLPRRVLANTAASPVRMSG
ncbi:MAG: COX15/CtaA family protein [Candidatus Omnitrophica bacterium]|nr:COX15/CtaA family protein [Candidatus Omnitrophota bacterium]